MSGTVAMILKPKALDAWLAARLLTGLSVVDDELAGASELIRPMLGRLAAEPDENRRQDILEGFSLALPGRDEFLRTVALIARDEPPPIDVAGVGIETGPGTGAGPGADRPARVATLADVRRMVADRPWPWPGWLAVALNSLAADPGTGKTVLAMSLAATLWHRRPWPDGQANELPTGTRTLWVPGDNHYAQLIELAERFGLPDDAVLLNSSENSPTDGLDLDDLDELASLGARIRAEAPGLVIIDTVGMVTSRNLCRPEDSRDFFGPLMRIANETTTPMLLLTHLSRDSQALGRRIVGASRVVWKLTHPDPDGQPDRRKLAVDKSYALKPPALGMTIGESGCAFDFQPPTERDTARPGRAPVRLEECKRWLDERLAAGPLPVKDVRTDSEKAGFAPRLLYGARDALDAEEFLLEGRKWWRLSPR